MAPIAPIVAQTPENEYKKNPDIRREDIAALQDWLKHQPHLPPISDLNLMVLYYSCENRSEPTKACVDLNLTLRTHFTGLFGDRDPQNQLSQHTFQTVLYAPLPTPTPEGYRAVYCRLTDYEPKNYHFAESIKCFLMMFDLWQLEEGTWPGFILIIDLDRVVLGHLARLDLMTIRQTLYFLQEVMPVRLKGVHFMNTPSFMDKLMALLKPFIKKDLMSLLYLHPTPDTMYKFVPKKCFPRDVGGDHDAFDTIRKDIVSKIMDNRSTIVEMNRNRVNESMRPGKPKSVDTIFGIEGSFKKLDID